jgi:hypothetical protein
LLVGPSVSEGPCLFSRRAPPCRRRRGPLPLRASRHRYLWPALARRRQMGAAVSIRRCGGASWEPPRSGVRRGLPASAWARQQAGPTLTRCLAGDSCHTRFSEENRMHLICVLGSEFHTYDRQMSVISQDITQNV